MEVGVTYFVDHIHTISELNQYYTFSLFFAKTFHMLTDIYAMNETYRLKLLYYIQYMECRWN